MIRSTTQNPAWDALQQIEKVRHDPFSLASWSYSLRSSFVRSYTWAIPDPESVQFVAQHLSPTAIEMGAGLGYWAWQVAQCGVDILAFDSHPPDTSSENHFHSPRDKQDKNFLGAYVQTFYPVVQGEPEILAHHYPDRTLFLCWPPYDEDMAHRCLKYYRGNKLVYIGESAGGCNGDDNFFHLLEEYWEQIDMHAIKQWDGIHDYIEVYKRIEEN